eukprot:TRINITY_DN65786_c0_g1_i1.p1 TRINITY_DN65786_c0_g1~~TRINITY_DN65786_c0_g1_i1.p1  ORF type:complete len:178 (+),score=46.18 TRINITY_DN65786_c0_g1_i1:75-536(+)
MGGWGYAKGSSGGSKGSSWGKGSKASSWGGGSSKGSSSWQKGGWQKGGWGNDYGKGSFGKGNGKGKRRVKFDADVMVWLSGIPEGTDFKALQEHLSKAGTCKYVKVMTGKLQGTGLAAYSSAEEANSAIGMLNGSDFQGSTLVVDTWEKQEQP